MKAIPGKSSQTADVVWTYHFKVFHFFYFYIYFKYLFIFIIKFPALSSRSSDRSTKVVKLEDLATCPPFHRKFFRIYSFTIFKLKYIDQLIQETNSVIKGASGGRGPTTESK